MGNRLFGVDISGLIAKNVGPGVLGAVLIKVAPGNRSATAITAGTNPTLTRYPCQGFIDKQRVRFGNGTVVRQDRKVVVLIGDSIDGGRVAPAPGDRIEIEGGTYVIPEGGMVDRDPAAATYTCEVATY